MTGRPSHPDHSLAATHTCPPKFSHGGRSNTSWSWPRVLAVPGQFPPPKLVLPRKQTLQTLQCSPRKELRCHEEATHLITLALKLFNEIHSN